MTAKNSLTALLCSVLFAGGCVVKLEDKTTVVAPDTGESADSTGTTGGTTGGEADQGPVETDGDKPPPPTCTTPPPCLNLGVCDVAPEPVCNPDGTWDCFPDLDDPAFEIPDYEAIETSCDGKDNDCDGTVDEDIVLENHASCGGENGVCANAAQARCVGADEWLCDYSAVDGYEAVEASCDGKDNDCNGQVDDITSTPTVACGWEGLCAQVVEIDCLNAAWDCDHSSYEIPLYEPDEVSCDGLDNDCDGEVDEGISGTGLAQADCPNVGLCAGAVVATCDKGFWDCDTSGVTGYEAIEKSCDGKDNDCDGVKDELETVVVKVSDCDPDSALKASRGVCNGSTFPTCLNGQPHCVFANVPGYEQVETLCDGEDNDCNGETDAGLKDPPPGECKNLGECGFGLDAQCVSGQWECNYSSLDHEPGVETQCDGKDNDCDGQVDEDIEGSGDVCTGFGKGVCKSADITAICVGGAWVCDYTKVPGYEPGDEASCDNQDNDCDGLVDEEIFDLAQSDCFTLGVCKVANKVQASCNGDGTWSCDYDAVPGYEPISETSCDNQDNDCDGIIDEDIADETGAFCNNVGICEGNVQAFCVGGTWACNFASVNGFENPEVSCDGADNNCDGAVDEGVCGTLAECTLPTQCVSGICRPTPAEESSFCVEDAGKCPTGAGDVQMDVGGGTCVSFVLEGKETWFVSTCTAGGWDTPLGSPCESGACANGQCKTCLPGKTTCDETGNIVLTCQESGDDFDLEGCQGDTNCAVGFPGVCLLHADSRVDPAVGTSASTANVTQGASGQLLLVYQAGEASSASAIAQNVSATAEKKGNFFTPQGGDTADTRPDVVLIDVIANAAAVVWQEGKDGGDPGNIRMRAMTFTQGTFAGPTLTVSAANEFEQGAPRIARLPPKGVMVVWQSFAEVNGFDVYLQTFNSTKTSGLYTFTASSDATLVNTTTDGNQTQPAIARLSEGSFIVAWTDEQANSNGSGVYARLVSKTAEPQGEAFELFGTAGGGQHDVQVETVDSGGFAAVWTTTQSGDQDVMLRLFDDTGAPTGPNGGSEILVTRAANGLSKPGNQLHADVAVFPNGSLAVVWEDSKSPGDEFGHGVVLRQFSSDLTPLAERQVNQDVGMLVANQGFPRVQRAGVNQAPWALVVYEHSELNGAGLPGLLMRPMVMAE